jgi:2'-5' RNA ligase
MMSMTARLLREFLPVKIAKTVRRIFVAIDINAAARANVEQFTTAIKRDFLPLRIGWEKPEKLHLTLKFLGDINEAQLNKLQNAAAETAANFSSFKLSLDSTGCFPSAKKAKILWIGLNGELEKLRGLYDKLEEKAEAYGFEREGRRFKPHLTVARLREPEKSQELADAFLQKQFEPTGFEVSEIAIYESKLQPTGSIYSVVSRHKLLFVS